MKTLLLSIALTTFGALTSLQARAQFPVTTNELRLESAQAHLAEKPNQVAVYSKGLVCSSCGIGLRIHIKKLDGLDDAKLDEGMFLDAKNQLVLIAFEPDFTPDMEAIRKAVDKAGYESTHYYKWNGKTVDLLTYSEAK
ncbi:MAG: heavy-metal-associated domain-containing protein [Opitutaceae bacterium]